MYDSVSPSANNELPVALPLAGDALWERMERAVEKVRERLLRATGALERANIPYAVVGGNAVRMWVAQVDEAAVRTTRDVDILLRRVDFPAARAALEAAGFVYRTAAGVTMFLDSTEAPARDAVHIVFANEPVRDDDPEPNPDVEPYAVAENFRTLQLETLVRMKLNSFRLKDRLHLADMLDVGVIDATWPARFPSPLRERLEQIIENPDA